MLTLHEVPFGEVQWARLDSFPDRVIFQTREWLAFVAETQGARPVVAALRDGPVTVGYFTGLVFRRYGIPLLGSPFPGWTTAYLGFNLQEGVPHLEALAALDRFAFGVLGCLHVEVRDRNISAGEMERAGFDSEWAMTYELDIEQTEDELFAGMTSAARRCIRKAEKVGVVVEEAGDDEFVTEYYAQLEDVFAKQSLRPPYSAERVAALVRHLRPTGRLLLLRARDPQGETIATGVFPAMNGTMYFWGGASWRHYQIMRPNEAIFWHAIRYWKSRGITRFDLGGGGDYKQKYGPRDLVVPFFRKSRFTSISLLRNLAKRVASRRLGH